MVPQHLCVGPFAKANVNAIKNVQMIMILVQESLKANKTSQTKIMLLLSY
jgi:hypothetical protein